MHLISYIYAQNKIFQNIFMHKINQNSINFKGKQNKDITYEKQLHIKKPLMILILFLTNKVIHTINEIKSKKY